MSDGQDDDDNEDIVDDDDNEDIVDDDDNEDIVDDDGYEDVGDDDGDEDVQYVDADCAVYQDQSARALILTHILLHVQILCDDLVSKIL